MKTRLILITAVLSLTALPFMGAQTTAMEPGPERLATEWMDALERKDLPALERLVAPDFDLSYVGDAEKPIPRAEWLDNGLRMNWDNRGYENIRVSRFDDVAVVTSTYSFRVDPGKWKPTVHSSAQVVDVWARRDGRWQVYRRFLGASALQRWIDRATGAIAAAFLIALILLFRSLRRRSAPAHAV